MACSHQSLVPSHQSLYLYLIKILDGSQRLAALKEGLRVNGDADAFASLSPQPDDFLTGYPVKNGGNERAHGMTEVCACLIDMVQVALEAVLTKHVFGSVAADALCAFAPVEDLAVCIDAVNAEGHLFDDLFEKFFVCYIHVESLISNRGQSAW